MFIEGIKTLPWKVYADKYLPLIKKISSLGYTSITRYAAAKIFISTVYYKANTEEEMKELVIDYCELFRSIDLNIRIAAIECLLEIVPKVKEKKELLKEVLNCFKDLRDETSAKAIIVITKLAEYFSIEQLRDEFIPEFIEKAMQSKEYKEVNKAMMTILSELIEFFISRSLITEKLTAILHKLFETGWKSCDMSCLTVIIPAIPSMAHLQFFTQKEAFEYQEEVMDRIKLRGFFLPFTKIFKRVNVKVTVASRDISKIFKRTAT